MAGRRFRISEWVLIAFFAYIVLIIPYFPDRPDLHLQPVVIFICTYLLIALVAYGDDKGIAPAISYFRDWLPLGLTLTAFREMELFIPKRFDYHLENIWVAWDYQLLVNWHLRRIIESRGSIFPFCLELCYFFVYGVGAYCLLVLYLRAKRNYVDYFFTIYLTGTLLAYALFPYFPSQPPRIAFPTLATPHVLTWMRSLNLAILNTATIHVGVFPSAHVSSVFSAAWGMFLVLPRRKIYGCGLVIYGICVSLATIYGRYHYTADVLAGLGISLVAGALALVSRIRRIVTETASPVTRC
jgi:membrane-associated phospholipid phosphatase